MLVRRAEIHGQLADLRIEEARISTIAPRLEAKRGERELDAAGGALLPGLYDHHLHFLSLAAAAASVRCGPPEVESRADLARALETHARTTPPGEWIRGAGYFESVAGPLDRDQLDALCPDHPVRIQHRSGVFWFLNSKACAALGLDDPARPLPSGAERDETGRANGRLFRLDEWLREQLNPRAGSSAESLAPLSRRLAGYGVTGFTDATPSNEAEVAAFFRRAQTSGNLLQHVMLMGDLSLALPRTQSAAEAPDLSAGPHKIMLDDAELPDLGAIVTRILAAHAQRRAAAIHTVTRGEIFFALAALREAGVRDGDRLEHASVSPPEAVLAAQQLGLRIVTQPNFVLERGDAYFEQVDAIDQPSLYRLRHWRERGVLLAGGTDAPFGDPDPWQAIRAATRRRTRSGRSLGADEALSPEEALGLFLSPLQDPGGPARRVEMGAPADLCLLSVPWQEARERLEATDVRATLIRGQLVWEAPD